MKSVTRLLARLLYPAAWRQRYGVEFDALLDDLPATWSHLVDVVYGGMTMRVRMSHPAVTILTLGLAGALVAGLGALMVPSRFEAHGTMKLMTGTTTGTSVDQRLPALMTAAMARAGSQEISRRDLAVTRTGDRDEIQLTYAASDPEHARDVVQRVMANVVEANLREAFSGLPPMQVRVQTPATLPGSASRPHLKPWSSVGALAGVMLGAAVSLRRRHILARNRTGV